jgi:hypothetical protein
VREGGGLYDVVPRDLWLAAPAERAAALGGGADSAYFHGRCFRGAWQRHAKRGALREALHGEPSELRRALSGAGVCVASAAGGKPPDEYTFVQKNGNITKTYVPIFIFIIFWGARFRGRVYATKKKRFLVACV